MGFSSPEPPKLKMPPPAAHPPTLASTTMSMAARNAQTVETAAKGGTVKTSPQGVKDKATMASTTLLGQ